MVAENDKVAERHGFRGTQHGHIGSHPPTGKVMTADYQAIYRIAGGVIAESWAEWDNLTGLVQFGHFTSRT
jgi:predicted ester cyclase